ncbi:MAG: chorismate-binding protein [Bacteroidota bacterium]|nr:isochorismate synthase [Odoribacter sp.]MDP3645438.1 chorismate-binding protein [Bacteroidota bacterium]
MENNSTAQAVLDQLIEKQIAFACWFYPQESQMGLIVGNASDVLFFDGFDQLNGEAGFVFAPYQITEKSPVILLKPKVYFEDFKSENELDIKSFEPFDQKVEDEICSPQSKDDYLKLIEETLVSIRDGALSKVIIARQIPIKKTCASLGGTFLQLHDQTPNALTFLVNLPVAGTWMGATPEVLIKSEGKYFETVSLAGTQVRKLVADEYFWSTKDIEEQAFVSRYMLDVFFNFDIHQYKTSGPETMESGKVAHLKTSFFFPAEKIADCLGSFIADLHPTPAVCGLPKDMAAEFILKNEVFERKYYTGYLGPWRLNQQVALFVNLRSMEITSEEYILYAGSGITSHSIPEKEWDETNQKAKTLLSVINPE